MTDPNLSTPSSSASTSELSELKELCAELRWQTHTLRIALLVVATVVCAYFALESRRNGQALEALRPQVAQIIKMNNEQGPAVERFLGQLVEYAKGHPDFNPIIGKYVRTTPVPGGAPTATPTPTSTVTKPVAPTTPVAPKK